MLLFDLDGTLIDSNGIWKTVDETFLSRRNLPYTREYYEGVAHTIFPLAAVFTKEYCRLEESCEEIMAEWMDLARGLYAAVPLKPGVRAYLEQCAGDGLPMALVTSSVPEHCRTALEVHDLTPFFRRVIFAQELGLEKKNPALWREAARLCGAEPAECVVYDDSLSAVRGAIAAGMRTVGVYDPLFAADAPELRRVCGAYVRSFAELVRSG